MTKISAPNLRPETKNSIILVLGHGATALISMVYAVHVGRALGPTDYADFTAAVALVAMLSVALGPINGIVTRFTAQYASRREFGKIRTLAREINKRLLVCCLGGLILALATLKPAAKVLNFSSPVPLLIAYGIICITLLLNIPRGVLRGVQNFTQYSVNVVLEASIRLTVGFTLLQLACGVVSSLLAYLAGVGGTLAVSVLQLRGVWGGHPAQTVDGAAIKRFTVPMFLLAIGGAGFQNIDMLFVKHYFTGEAAGHYGAAFTLVRVIDASVTPFNILMLPLIASLYERGERVGGALVRVCGYFLVLAAGPMLAFGLASGWIMGTLYGEGYAQAGPLLIGLAAARLVGYLANLLTLAHSAMNNFRFLWVYLPVMAAEAVALTIWHGSLGTVVTVVLATQAGVMTAMAAVTLGHQGRRRPVKPDGAGK